MWNMTNLKRSSFNARPFHLVSPSRWPLNTPLFPLYLVKCLAANTTFQFGTFTRGFHVSPNSLGFVVPILQYLTPSYIYQYTHSRLTLHKILKSSFFSTFLLPFLLRICVNKINSFFEGLLGHGLSCFNLNQLAIIINLFYIKACAFMENKFTNLNRCNLLLTICFINSYHDVSFILLYISAYILLLHIHHLHFNKKLFVNCNNLIHELVLAVLSLTILYLTILVLYYLADSLLSLFSYLVRCVYGPIGTNPTGPYYGGPGGQPSGGSPGPGPGPGGWGGEATSGGGKKGDRDNGDDGGDQPSDLYPESDSESDSDSEGSSDFDSEGSSDSNSESESEGSMEEWEKADIKKSKKKAKNKQWDQSEKGKATKAAWKATPKGKKIMKESSERYNQSEHGKAKKAEWSMSEKGKASRKLSTKKYEEKNQEKIKNKRKLARETETPIDEAYRKGYQKSKYHTEYKHSDKWKDTQSKGKKARRARETEEERKSRLDANKAYKQKKLSEESPAAREERLSRARQNYYNNREKRLAQVKKRQQDLKKKKDDKKDDDKK